MQRSQDAVERSCAVAPPKLSYGRKHTAGACACVSPTMGKVARRAIVYGSYSTDWSDGVVTRPLSKSPARRELDVCNSAEQVTPLASQRGTASTIGWWNAAGFFTCADRLRTGSWGCGSLDCGTHGPSEARHPAIVFVEGTNRSAVVDEIRTSCRADGTTAIHAPGDLESQTAVRNREAGIPLNDTTLADIREAAASLGVPDLLRT